MALLIGALLAAPPVHAGIVGCSPDWSEPQAELYATDNTAIIGDAADPRLQDRLQLFELQVDATVLGNAGLPAGSTLLDGVFWSSEPQQATYERSRDFHLQCVGELELHAIATQVREQFHQESVLVFAYRRQGAPDADAVTVEVPDVDPNRFHDALAGDPLARARLGGGSVTEQHTLILVADIADLGVARSLAIKAGGQAGAAAVRYGHREFVD
ncbi:hypothetical protein [Mycobacterium sp. 852002-51057_SCH5723018]|uniref:hypothetical protein n=1 Tax=Mycobacterium sp. 852002-51057_SCH5723018 TaxID=1834094 RepID=UPI0018D41A0E|nr:hypothetical protein [Mycobacterium sp. 852002-51057_SCH5723018]